MDKEKKNQADRSRYSREKVKDRKRWLMKTRQRAFERLAKEFPERFKEILEEERNTKPEEQQ